MSDPDPQAHLTTVSVNASMEQSRTISCNVLPVIGVSSEFVPDVFNASAYNVQQGSME